MSRPCCCCHNVREANASNVPYLCSTCINILMRMKKEDIEAKLQNITDVNAHDLIRKFVGLNPLTAAEKKALAKKHPTGDAVEPEPPPKQESAIEKFRRLRNAAQNSGHRN